MRRSLVAHAPIRGAVADAGRRVGPVALLLAVVLVAYGPAVPAFFTSDDLDMLSGDASDLFSPTSGFGRFMPLAASVHRATAVLAGLDPVPAHTFQLALHAGAVLLVYALVRALASRARDGARLALIAALLFALYPRHHQVVMWFGAVSIGLATLLCLATALLCLRAWRTGSRRLGWAAVAAYAAALLAHESAVVLPALLAVIALFERAHRPSAPVPRWAWTMAAVSLVHLATLAWAYRVRAAMHPDAGYRFLGLGSDLAAAPLRYAAQVVVPPPWTEPLAQGTTGLLLGGLALAGAGWWAWRAGPLARLGLGWLGVAALPFVLFGVYGVTDRYYYLPGVGLALATAVALMRWRRVGIGVLTVYGAAALLVLAQVGGEWRAAGATVRATMTYLARWTATTDSAVPPAAVAFVGVPFKRGERWPGSQVYVWSTGLVGATHLATDRPGLEVSYVFADEHPTLGAWLATLPPTPGPPGLYLFALDGAAPADRTAVLGAALPELARLRWRGASRTPIAWERYAGGAPSDTSTAREPR